MHVRETLLHDPDPDRTQTRARPENAKQILPKLPFAHFAWPSMISTAMISTTLIIKKHCIQPFRAKAVSCIIEELHLSWIRRSRHCALSIHGASHRPIGAISHPKKISTLGMVCAGWLGMQCKCAMSAIVTVSRDTHNTQYDLLSKMWF